MLLVGLFESAWLFALNLNGGMGEKKEEDERRSDMLMGGKQSMGRACL